MNLLNTIGRCASRVAMTPAGLKLRKHAPAIFTGVGIVGMIGGTVLACKATASAVDTMNDWEVYKEENEDVVSEEEMKKISNDMTKKIVKSYIPAVAVDAASIGCIIGGAKISHARLLTMTGIATSTAANFASYRNRVRIEEGDEKDLLYLRGGSETEVVERKETKKGNIKEVKKKVTIPNPEGESQYGFQFKRGDAGWSNNPEYNLYFLKNVETQLNRKFKLQGYMFLNQVYDELGIRDDEGKWLMTQEGQLVGWFDDGTDKRISFGIDYAAGLMPWNWDGNNYIWIEPNVDGVIIDKI